MAKVTKAGGESAKTGMRMRKLRPVMPKVKLPKKPETPCTELNDFSFLFHGEKKVGKTTLALEGGRVLVLQFDPPQRAYERMEIQCPDWRTFLASLKALEKADAPYDRVVLDGADLWYHHCQAYVCEKQGIEHPGDAGWGKGWSALRNEFTHAVDRMLNLSCGVWFLCHSTWKEVDVRRSNGRTEKVEKLLPMLSGMAEEILNGKVDGWFAYDYRGNNRVLVLQGDERTGAGHRLDQDKYPHFRLPEGEKITEMMAGKSASIAYKRFLAAFNNEYTPPVMKKVTKRKGK